MAQAVAQRHLQDGVVDPVPCPSYEQYKEHENPAWNEGIVAETHRREEGSSEKVAALFHKDERGKLDHPIFTERGVRRLSRAIAAYLELPQSYRDRIWRREVDTLVANEKDNQLAPDSDFLPRKEMTDLIWADVLSCQTMCPGGCPWDTECDTFYNVRKPRWDKQIENSKICRQRWIEEEELRRGDEASDKRRATLQKKKVLLKERLREEKKLAKQLFNPPPTAFEGSDAIVAAIREFIHVNEGSPHPTILHSAMRYFSTPLPALTLLDFQCIIADYFHDGLPGFRITSKADPKISGIRVHDSKMIRIGKESHHLFMYQFIRNVLKSPYPRIQPVIASLTDAQRTLQNVPDGTPATAALQQWRESIKLEGRIEDSIGPHLASRLPIKDRIPLDTYENVKRFSINEVVSAEDPIIPYFSYLESGQRHLTLYIEKGEIATLTQGETRILLRFLLLVLFGPSYETALAANPVMFTFDAHKGHMNRILSQAMLQHVHRLVTPYNIADSAMTERFAVDDPDEEYLVSEIAQEGDDEDENEEENEEEMQDDVVEKNRKAKEEAEIKEEEEEDEDDEFPAAQQGSSRFIFSSHSNAKNVVVVSDTNMMFDNNWLIYYKNKGFTQHNPLLFSMNLSDAGLHQFITQNGIAIPSSLYTIEAPFDNGITRGPSLNYLMLGLLRGKNSNVFHRKTPFGTNNELYGELCSIYPRIKEDRFIEKLLPIYTIPASPQSLPLFQHIARAPLFAYHMMYDLQYNLSALPSRIKWAGDREQYMAIHGKPHCAFVTLDTTGHLCALAKGITSLLERKTHIKLVGLLETPAELAAVKERARLALIEQGKRQAQPVLQKGKRKSDEASLSRKIAKPALPPITLSSDSYTLGNANMGVSKTTKKTKGKKRGGAHGNDTRKNSPQKHSDIVLGREYFFLNWLYPLTIFVNGAFHMHHAENAYVLLQDLQKDLSSPFLFSALHEQFMYAVSQIPHVPKKLLASAKEITADTYESAAPQCASLLTSLYTPPSSIFSDPIRAKTLIEQLVQMKQRFIKRYPYRDSTANLLHTLLTQEDQESACLVLALLFERLHGRIQSGTSYLGQILGITGGPILERVDDQAAWEYLATVMEEDMKRVSELGLVNAPVVPTAPIENAAPTNATPIAVRRISAKRHHVKRGPAFRKMNNAFTQLRSNRASTRASRAPTRASRTSPRVSRVSRVSRAPMTQNSRRVIMGGSRTRRAKGSQRSRRSQCKD
jgi:hypothetical protein